MKKHTHPCVNEPCPTTAGMVDVLLSSGWPPEQTQNIIQPVTFGTEN